MEYARERGKLVTTRDAFPHRYYSCPTCSKDVFLRRGKKYAAHFAHRSGYGKPECENFHPSDELRKTWARQGGSGNSNESARSISPLAVSIELEPEASVRRGQLRQWGLRLTVPKADQGYGKFTLDCGRGPKRTISLSSLVLAPQTYPVDVEAEDFRVIWISPDVPANYKAAIEPKLRGLDHDVINIFAATSQKYKPRVDRLTWGHSYYFLWRADADITLHSHLPVNPLAARDQWNCIFTSLPDEEDADLKEWLEESSGLQLAPERTMVGVVFPPTCGMDVSGRLNIPRTSRMVLGFHLADADGDETVKVGDGATGVSFEARGRHFAEISSDTALKSLQLFVGDAPLPLMIPAGRTTQVEWPEVHLSFRFEQRGGQTTLGLHTAACIKLLRDVRNGECIVASCEYPSVISGVLKWRRAEDIEWQSLELRSSDGSAAQEAATLVKLNEILRQRQLEVILSFGCFGEFHESAERVTQPQPSETSIPVSLRQRVLWLLKTAHVYCDGQKIPLDRLDDKHLKLLFHSVQVPPALAAHKRWLAANLNTEPGGQPHA
jgi:hypothetical protein